MRNTIDWIDFSLTDRLIPRLLETPELALYLSFRDRDLDHIPQSLSQLPFLKHLDLSENRRIFSHDQRGIDQYPLDVLEGSLMCLEHLYLSENDLSSIRDWIFHLPSLNTLVINDNRLNRLWRGSPTCFNLKILNISNNQLTHLPSSIGSLINLNELYVSNNQLTHLPSSIQSLTNLNSLDVSFNQLTHLPSSIGSLTNLYSLNVYANQLTDLPSSIGSLTNLDSLYLYGNQLTHLPSSIGSLTKLDSLNVSNNQLTDLPSSIRFLTNLERFNITNNKFDARLQEPDLIDSFQPTQLLVDRSERWHGREIVAYAQEWSNGRARLDRFKVALVGDGAAGKTSLKIRLINSSLSSSSSSSSTPTRRTTSIQRHGWHPRRLSDAPSSSSSKRIDDLSSSSSTTTRSSMTEWQFDVWDFPGQAQHYATHNLFLSDWQCVFVIVCDVSLSNWESRLEYWMSFLRCKSSLVIDRYHPHHFDHSSSSSSSSINHNNHHQSERDHHQQSITDDDDRVVFTAIVIGTHIDQVGSRSSTTNISQQRMSNRFSTKIQELERRQEHRHIKIINGGLLDLSHQSSSTDQQQERGVSGSSSSWRDIERLVSSLISIGDSMYSSSRSLVPSSYKLVFDWIQRHRCSIIENHNNNNSRSMIDDHDEYSITSTSTSSSDRCVDVSASRSSTSSRSAPMMTIGRMMIELSIDDQQPHDDGCLQHQEPRRTTSSFEREKKIDKQRLVWILRQLHGFGEVMFMPPHPRPRQLPLDDDESSIDDDHDGHGSSRYHHHHDDDRQRMAHHRVSASNHRQEEEISDSEPVVLSFNWLLCRIGEMFDEPDLLDDDPTDHQHQRQEEWIDHVRYLKYRTQGIWSTTDLAELWNLSPFDPIDQQSIDRETTSLTMIESLAMILERMMMCYRLDAPRSSSSPTSFVFPLLLPMIDDDQRQSLMLPVQQQGREVMMSRWIRSQRAGAGGGALPPGAFGTFQVYWFNLLRDARVLSSNATSSSSSSHPHLHHHQQVDDDHQLDQDHDDEIDWREAELSMYLNEVHMFLNGELVMIASFHNPSLVVDRDPLHINTTSRTGPLDSMINVMFISNTNIDLPHNHQQGATATRSIKKYREIVRSAMDSINQAFVDCQYSSNKNKKSNKKMKMIEEEIPCIECVRSQWSSSSRISVCKIFSLDECRSSKESRVYRCSRTKKPVNVRSLIGIDISSSAIPIDCSTTLSQSATSITASAHILTNVGASIEIIEHDTVPAENVELWQASRHLQSSTSRVKSLFHTHFPGLASAISTEMNKIKLAPGLTWNCELRVAGDIAHDTSTSDLIGSIALDIVIEMIPHHQQPSSIILDGTTSRCLLSIESAPSIELGNSQLSEIWNAFHSATKEFANQYCHVLHLQPMTGSNELVGVNEINDISNSKPSMMRCKLLVGLDHVLIPVNVIASFRTAANVQLILLRQLNDKNENIVKWFIDIENRTVPSTREEARLLVVAMAATSRRQFSANIRSSLFESIVIEVFDALGIEQSKPLLLIFIDVWRRCWNRIQSMRPISSIGTSLEEGGDLFESINEQDKRRLLDCARHFVSLDDGKQLLADLRSMGGGAASSTSHQPTTMSTRTRSRVDDDDDRERSRRRLK